MPHPVTGTGSSDRDPASTVRILVTRTELINKRGQNIQKLLPSRGESAADRSPFSRSEQLKTGEKMSDSKRYAQGLQ